MKILHIIGGSPNNGSFKGANILHKALLNLNIDSKILNDTSLEEISKFDKDIITINYNFVKKIKIYLSIFCEKILKSFFLHTPRETFTIGFFGSDITKTNEYKEADLIHIHWLNQGFLNLKSLSKIKKPLIWTMRDMWAFTGGAHYTMDFEYYENSSISKFIKKIKRNTYNKHFKFVAVSKWLKEKAENSDVLKGFDILKIDNNIDLNQFEEISKKNAKNILEIKTKKQIILYGAQNPQSKRKGWDLFLDAIKKIDKSKFFLLIFGNFWSNETLDKIGIEYKSLGYIDDKKLLSATYSCADMFVASSIQDAWPKTFAEAIYCGTPVICFDKTSLSEVVEHKLSGFIVEDFDSDKLKNGILWVSNEIQKGSFKDLNFKKKIMNYDAKIIANKYIELYRKLLN